MKTNNIKFYSGTSNLVLPVPNKSHYPPAYRDKSRLTYYSSLFNSIEINSSFYKIPQRMTVEKWSAMVPETFRFTFKLFKEITHQKKLKYSVGDIDRFLTAVEGAGKKKGCLLLQLPGGTKSEQYGRLESLLSDLSGHKLINGWKLAVELRDTSWYINETWELLNEFKAGLVYHDLPKSRTPGIELKANWIYLRYHGPTGNYRGSYETGKLETDAGDIRNWLKTGKSVYAYFNNTLGAAITDLQTLNRMLPEIATH